MARERELSSAEVAELEVLVPEACRLAGIEPGQTPAAAIGALDESIGRLRADARDEAENVALGLGYLLGEQWRIRLGWQWRYVSLDDSYEGYGVVSADRGLVYFPMQKMYSLLTDEGSEVNILLLFNMVVAGMSPSTSEETRYLPLT